MGNQQSRYKIEDSYTLCKVEEKIAILQQLNTQEEADALESTKQEVKQWIGFEDILDTYDKYLVERLDYLRICYPLDRMDNSKKIRVREVVVDLMESYKNEKPVIDICDHILKKYECI
jgi:hypothetical protein